MEPYAVENRAIEHRTLQIIEKLSQQWFYLRQRRNVCPFSALRAYCFFSC